LFASKLRRLAALDIDTCNVSRYTILVIRSFKHKGLERFFLRGTKTGIQAPHASKLRLVLSRLHASVSPNDMDLPGLFLHQLRGKSQGTWSVRVSGNWRVTFRFEGQDAIDVNYEDYH
jgi:proteic killer suppression protein